jgi:hypothetical protein
MKTPERLLREIRNRMPQYADAPLKIWDVLRGNRGLTIILTDGSLLLLEVSDGAAETLLHEWSVASKTQ